MSMSCTATALWGGESMPPMTPLWSRQVARSFQRRSERSLPSAAGWGSPSGRRPQCRGFRAVAVEADWPDAARIDRYVRHLTPTGPRQEPAFSRFPTWMWRNQEVHEFVEWLRHHNAEAADPARRVSFHGLDLYSLYAS